MESHLPDGAPETDGDFDSQGGIHSFIVRVWLELRSAETDEEIWRGHIIHLPSYKRHYFTDINEITIFIASQLKDQH